MVPTSHSDGKGNNEDKVAEGTSGVPCDNGRTSSGEAAVASSAKNLTTRSDETFANDKNRILDASLCNSSRKKCETYIKQFYAYCLWYDVSPKTQDVHEILNYFTYLFEKGLSFSTLKAAMSALAQLVYLPPYATLSDYPQIIKFFKGAFNLRLPLPKFGFVWDVALELGQN